MKNFLIILFVFVSASINAQTSVYHPFPDSNAVWSITYDGYEASYCYDRLYFLSGDTVINGNNYHKLYYMGSVGFANPATHFCGYWQYSVTEHYFGGIRQDTTLRKVFYIPKDSTNDTLLFNFNLNVGEPLPRGINNNFTPNNYVESIDSIFIGNNYRKRINIWTPYGTTNLIEGIGSINGLTEDIVKFESGGTLNCFSQNFQQIYPDTISVCLLFTNIKDLKKKNERANISPNPFSTTTELIVLNYSKEFEFVLYDSYGRVVKQQKINSEKTMLNRNDLSDGLYFYQLKQNNVLISTGKLIIN
jgi:hypothetical protein